MVPNLRDAGWDPIATINVFWFALVEFGLVFLIESGLLFNQFNL